MRELGIMPSVSGSILATSCHTSIMGLLALNRYITVVKRALCRKLFYSKRLVRLYCSLFGWLLCFRYTFIMRLGNQSHFEFSACPFSWHINHSSHSTLIAVKGITIAILYSKYKIYEKAKEGTQTMNAHGEEDRTNGISGIPYSPTDISVLKICFTVVCFFVMAWFALSIVILSLETFGCNIPREVYVTCAYSVLYSSMVNPIIYGIINPQFELAL